VSVVDWSSALIDPQALRVQGLFLAEGRLVLERILAGAAGGPGAVVSVLATPAAVRALRLDERVSDRLTTRTPAEMESITGFNFHRGVLALVRRPPALAVGGLIRRAIADRETDVRYPDSDAQNQVPGTRNPALLVVAEHLVDVDNVGSCFRNARAFGAAALLLDERCPDPLYRKAVRTSMAAVFEVPWAHGSMSEILDSLAAAGVITVGLTPDASAATLDEIGSRVARQAAIALVVGNEGHGLSEDTRARCTHLARIAMADGADSLNVATALAVALYEWQLRRH
jgi:tRNA G18 (ribose-2'-O)-methylase SpoU